MSKGAVVTEPMRALFESAPNGVAVLDSGGRLLLANTPLARMFGYEIAALEGGPAAVLFSSSSIARQAELQAQAAVSRGDKVHEELSGLRRDGGEFPIDVVFSPFRGQPGLLLMIVMDVTERRQAEERQNLLIGELHHRTQNIFAVIQSVASRTLSGDRTLADARHIFLNRLHAMSRTYTMLTEGAWEGAPLERIVRDELAAFSNRAAIAGPPVMI